MINKIYFLAAVLCTCLFACQCSESGDREQVLEAAHHSATYETLEELDSAIAQMPDQSDLYFQRFEYLLEQGDTFSAMIDINQAMLIDSFIPEYYIKASELFIQLGDVIRALQLVNKGIALMPEQVALYIVASEYHLYMMRYETMLEYIDKALKLDPTNADVYFLLGYMYKETGDTIRMISSMQTCIEYDPMYYQAHIQLGLIYTSVKDPLAVIYFDNAIRIDSLGRDAHYGKAYFYQQMRQYDKALSTYKNMLTISNYDPEVLYNLGFTYLEMDSIETAYHYFERSVLADSSYAEAYYMMGHLSEMQGNVEEAKLNYQQALHLYPENEMIKEALSRLSL